MATHFYAPPAELAHCGRRFGRVSTTTSSNWEAVTCSYCLARRPADVPIPRHMLVASGRADPLPEVEIAPPWPERRAVATSAIAPVAARVLPLHVMAMARHLVPHLEVRIDDWRTALCLLSARMLGTPSDLKVSDFLGYRRGFVQRRFRRLKWLKAWEEDRPRDYLHPEHGAIDLALDVKTAQGQLEPE